MFPVSLRPPTGAPPSMNPLRRTSKEGHVLVSTTVPIVSETPLSPSTSDDPPPLGIAIPLKRPKPPPTCPARLVLFCANLMIGLVLSQLLPEWLEASTYETYKHVIKIITMFHLSYIMINVGFEFDIDKGNLSRYGTDYAVACTAATFPWILCSLYFMFCLGEGHNVEWRMALVAGRFAAPTSAGILFTMLEAAGMKETWLFQKARILAIFDDLDTLLLMVPLKAIVVGARWELSIDLVVVVVLVVLMYKYLHRLRIPTTWSAIMGYAAAITAVCELTHFFTHSTEVDPGDVVETIHLEVLLPAFTVGCIAVHEHNPKKKTTGPRTLKRQSTSARLLTTMKDARQEDVKFMISTVFMVLVGLSMPTLFNISSLSDSAHRQLAEATHGSVPSANESALGSDHGSATASLLEPLSGGMIVVHVVACSLLMNLGKLFPAFVYSKEVGRSTRIALAVGMMPRGEVCAGIIVNAIALGVQGAAVTIAVLCLAVNMMCVSGFIFIVKKLAGSEKPVLFEQQSGSQPIGVPAKPNLPQKAHQTPTLTVQALPSPTPELAEQAVGKSGARIGWEPNLATAATRVARV